MWEFATGIRVIQVEDDFFLAMSVENFLIHVFLSLPEALLEDMTPFKASFGIGK
jgi:hypothetical protein